MATPHMSLQMCSAACAPTTARTGDLLPLSGIASGAAAVAAFVSFQTLSFRMSGHLITMEEDDRGRGWSGFRSAGWNNRITISQQLYKANG
ncbi:hypothetical protein LINPERPRIM_LOCUS36260 [Linum perenne]